MRRSISFPQDLERRLVEEAGARGLSFSATVVALLDELTGAGPLPYEATGEGPSDLSTRAEDYLDELAGELRR
jgi:hypothetical protein